MDAARLLLFSGGLAIFFSSLLGVAMLVPMQPWGQRLVAKAKLKPIGAAHLDWIVLALMQGLAAGVIVGFDLSVSPWAAWALVFGGWANPLPYVFRAFGVNAFAFAGPLHQRLAAALGGLSSAAILYGWAVILTGAWTAWPP
ncbi:hypothetical protein [Haliangium sp.]|uniref:hypothetical protein n=1 Tax=Haliangium sp. TaxID=2663208 RepID=UPI003D120FBF